MTTVVLKKFILGLCRQEKQGMMGVVVPAKWLLSTSTNLLTKFPEKNCTFEQALEMQLLAKNEMDPLPEWNYVEVSFVDHNGINKKLCLSTRNSIFQ